jgi:hypothetical protein
MVSAYLGCLFCAEPDRSFVELDWRLRTGGMGREFLAARDRHGLTALIEARGRTTDLYIGVAPRSREEGTRAAVEGVHAAWTDLDSRLNGSEED